MALLKYSTAVKIINGNPYVEVPEKLLQGIFEQAGRDKQPIPVKGKLNGANFVQTLMRYEGDWRLYLNGVMLKAAEIMFKSGDIASVVGKEVEIEVGYDNKSRELEMHPKLQSALDKDNKASKAYEGLSPSRKHEILRYLSFLKTEEKVDLNIKRILQHLRGEESDALYPLMHRKRGE